MVDPGAYNLEQLQEKIEPILNEILNNHPTFKKTLQKYGVLEATSIELKLDTNKVEIQGVNTRGIEEPNLESNVTQSRDQEILLYQGVWCPSLGCVVAAGKCPP